MKIHIWSIIKYILIFFVIIFFILVFKQNYLVFLLFPYVILPAGLIPLFMINVKKVKVTGGTNVGSADKGNNIVFYLEYDNPTYFPFLKCSLRFILSNRFFENNGKRFMNFNMFPKRKDRVNMDVATSKIGMVVFEGEKLEITGFLGMVSYRFPAEFAVQVPVFPSDSESMQVPETPYSEGYDEYSEPDLKGNLSSDIKEIREYRPGDRLARIHWKLSAKMEELAVKEMERTSVMSLVIVPELEKTLIGETVKTLDAVSRELAKAGERFEICLYNDKICSFDYFMIDNEETLFECYRNLYFLPLYEKSESAREAYYASHQKSSLVLTVYGDKVRLFEDNLEIRG
ncbi:MAG: DUF58 domain-containing protein [Lachnospiraceae bacterium]|nr:DUF58 domain-containing protein [Lachnospiraceae bacterium]